MSTPAWAQIVIEDVDLTEYDVISVSTSGGKDSQAMMDLIVKKAEAAGVKDRVVAIHADLGRVEWKGTKELAAEQCEAYGIPLTVVSRIGGVSKGQCKEGVPLYAKGEEYGDLLDQVEHRYSQMKALGKVGPAWMSAAARYCTSDHKRGPIGTFFTEIARQWKTAHPELAKTRPCKILDCVGLRGQESKKRTKSPNLKVKTSTKAQHVVTWLPIQNWSTKKVWATIKASGVKWHYAYDLHMPRLSCVFCVFASRDALMIAANANPELLAEFVRVEKKVGAAFKVDFDGTKIYLADIQADLAAGVPVPTMAEDWDDAA